MLEARKYYNDGVKFLNMDDYRGYYTNFKGAIQFSYVVIGHGRNYGSRSCG